MNTTIPENTWHGFSTDTLLNTGITIFIFFSGYIANRFYERYKRKRDLNTLKKYFVYVVSHIDEPVKDQATNFSKFSSALKANNSKDRVFNLRHSLIPALENVKQIKHTDLYDIYLKCKSSEVNKRAADLQKFHASIHLIEYVHKTYAEKHDSFSKTLSRHEKEWNINMNAILRYYDEQVPESIKGSLLGGDDVFIKNVGALLKKLTTIPDYSTHSVALKNFITPLIALSKEQVADSRAPVFIKYAIECNSIYRNMEIVNRNYRIYIVTTARKLNLARLDLKESIKEIK